MVEPPLVEVATNFPRIFCSSRSAETAVGITSKCRALDYSPVLQSGHAHRPELLDQEVGGGDDATRNDEVQTLCECPHLASYRGSPNVALVRLAVYLTAGTAPGP